MGLADEFTVEMAQFVTADDARRGAACRADRAECVCQASAGRRDLPLSPHDEGMRAAHLPVHAEGAADASTAGGSASWYEDRPAVSARHGRVPAKRGLRRAAAHAAEGCRHSAFLAAPEGRCWQLWTNARQPMLESASAGDSGADAEYVQLAQYPENAGAEGAAADGDLPNIQSCPRRSEAICWENATLS